MRSKASRTNHTPREATRDHQSELTRKGREGYGMSSFTDTVWNPTEAHGSFFFRMELQTTPIE